jgi:hypothetical protein
MARSSVVTETCILRVAGAPSWLLNSVTLHDFMITARLNTGNYFGAMKLSLKRFELWSFRLSELYTVPFGQNAFSTFLVPKHSKFLYNPDSKPCEVCVSVTRDYFGPL